VELPTYKPFVLFSPKFLSCIVSLNLHLFLTSPPSIHFPQDEVFRLAENVHEGDPEQPEAQVEHQASDIAKYHIDEEARAKDKTGSISQSHEVDFDAAEKHPGSPIFKETSGSHLSAVKEKDVEEEPKTESV